MWQIKGAQGCHKEKPGGHSHVPDDVSDVTVAHTQLRLKQQLDPSGVHSL